MYINNLVFQAYMCFLIFYLHVLISSWKNKKQIVPIISFTILLFKEAIEIPLDNNMTHPLRNQNNVYTMRRIIL